MGRATTEVQQQLAAFYRSVHAMFEAWLGKYPSPHTRPTYARGVMSLVDFLGIPWPDEASRLLEVTVKDVQLAEV